MRKTNFSTHFFHPLPESGPGRHATANAELPGMRGQNGGKLQPTGSDDTDGTAGDK